MRKAVLIFEGEHIAKDQNEATMDNMLPLRGTPISEEFFYSNPTKFPEILLVPLFFPLPLTFWTISFFFALKCEVVPAPYHNENKPLVVKSHDFQ